MKVVLLPAILSCAAICASAQMATGTLRSQVEAQMPTLEKTYLSLHQAPELSRHEEKTSAFLAATLRELGYEVTDHIGVYADGTKGFGIVALMENGAGPTVLIRSDMDGLPVTEQSGMSYSSKVRSKNPEGEEVGVMHACGHDIHMSVLLGVAKELAENKAAWHGTAMLVGQPAEEVIAGANAMLADHLYTRFPRPDYILGEHDFGNIAAGTVALSGGPVLASSDSVNIVFHGAGAHGSQPQNAKDPIFMGAEFVTLVQGVVSRQISPQSPGVITVGTFHAGTKNNIIPDDATLGLTVRSYNEDTRTKLLDGIRNAARGVAVAYGLPDGKMPTMTTPEGTGPTINDSALTERLRSVAVQTLGADHVIPMTPIMGSEDVGAFNLHGQIPMTFFALGAANPAKLAIAEKEGKLLPNIHSALYAPDYQPAIRTGVEVMTAMAVALLK